MSGALCISIGLMMFLLVKDDYVYCFEMILCFMFLIGALCKDQQLMLSIVVLD